ncbi:hypothetical protein ACQKGO_35605 [Corallococcus interemptor]|uniref:hypothetical protein n=1 Tax=Corallococcus interemptor TaxID=2316720 RepID=UPI003CFEA286
MHPDAAKPAPHAVFALMLMYDPIEKAKELEFSKYRHLEDSALAREVKADKGLTGAWLDANARAFVSKVTRSGSFVDIHVTHPAWVEHLRKRMTWRTTAYDAGPGQPAEPRVPVALQGEAPAPRKTARKAAVKKAAVKKAAVKKTGAKKAAVKKTARKAAVKKAAAKKPARGKQASRART